MATKRPRYMISVDEDMFNAIEDFRFEKRFQTRSEATAELIRLGLKALEKQNLEEALRKRQVIVSKAAAWGGETAEGTINSEQMDDVDKLIEENKVIKDK